jgi:hypothetical protein
VVYPRARRSKVPRRAITAADTSASLAAFEEGKPVDERVVALWSLRGAPSTMMMDGRTVAERIGALLNHDDLVLASEAYEALCALHVDDGEAERDLAVGSDARGNLFVAAKRIDAYVHEPGATAAKRLVPLTKIGVLAPSTSAALVQFPKIVAGNDLVLERAPHARMPAASLRVRGDEVSVGSLRQAALNLPLARRHLRFKREGADGWAVQDVYAEGFASIGGTRVAQKSMVKHGTRIDVAADDRVMDAGVAVTARFAPRLDRRVGLTLRFRDRGTRVERLAAGEALFLGPHEHDDVATPFTVRIVAAADGSAVVLAAQELTQAKGVVHLGPGLGLMFERDDIVFVDL